MTAENSPEGPLRPRVGAIVVAGLGGFLLGQVLAAVATSVAVSLLHFPGGVARLSAMSAPPWWANAIGLFSLWIGFGVAIAFAFGPGGLRPWPAQWRARWSDVAFLLGGVLAQGLVDAAYAPFHLHSLGAPVHHLFDGSRGLTFVLVATLSALGAPVVEEWFFRGTLLHAISGSKPTRARATVAVLVSAMLFGLAHGEPLQLPGLFALGVLLGVVALRQRRLVPVMLMHIGFNVTALVALVSQRAGH